MDFHPVILAGGRGSRMYPLTEEFPKALLPVGNMPLIWYTIQLLEKHGFKEALVVVRDSQHGCISEALEGLQTRHGVLLKFTLCDIPEQEEWGTADALRFIRPKVKGDVLLMSCDLITLCSLRSLVLFHHKHHSTLTALLLNPTQVEESVPKKPNKTAVADQQDLIGIAEDTRMVLFSSQADIEEHLQLSLTVLHKHPHMRIFSKLMDAHLFLMKRWVVDYLVENKSLSSVKGELVPHLVHYQSRPTNPTSKTMVATAQPYMNVLEDKAYQMSSSSNSNEWAEHVLSCHAQLVKDVVCLRVNTLPAYHEANRLVSHNLQEFDLQRWTSSNRNKGYASSYSLFMSHPLFLPLTDIIIGVSVGGDSIVSSEGVMLGEKVSIKHSCVGQHCFIGDKTRIVNCIVMDHVHIGEGCVLQSSILSSHVRLEDHVSLKDCQVGANFTVTKEADLKGEALVVGGGMHF